VNESKYKLQLRTNREQEEEVKEILPGWECVSFGYIPTTQEDILIFEKEFHSEIDWTNFLKSDTITETIEMKEA
jgi:hypothetical protein